MGVIYVARSVGLGKWGADVGLSKHIYKIGYTEAPLKPLIAAGWAGEHDWAPVAKQEAEGLTEDEVIARVARKQKMVDPGFYPRLKGATGNIVMDDLVFMLEAMGLRTGVDVERLVAVREIVARALPHVKLHGGIAKAGLPKGFRAATTAQQLLSA